MILSHASFGGARLAISLQALHLGGSAVVVGLLMSLLHVTAPPERTGEAVGLRAAMVSLSQTVLPLAVGGLGAAVGMVPLFWGISALLAGGAGYAARRRRMG